ncbi:hypothetical protein FACS1894186_0780 [Alphaproteobacteria bacterium]|nr:hypothetical protein FACS1894186_0780 [Alphaproteobacteria bacterium]
MRARVLPVLIIAAAVSGVMRFSAVMGAAPAPDAVVRLAPGGQSTSIAPASGVMPRDEGGALQSETELELLRQAQVRAKDIDKALAEVESRREILRAAESQIDAKITKLQALEENLKRLLGQYDEKERGKIDSLVRIYSNMKPKDAARILGELDMDIQLSIFTNMKESKSAPIMAAMEQERARQLTQEMAARRPSEAGTAGLAASAN